MLLNGVSVNMKTKIIVLLFAFNFFAESVTEEDFFGDEQNYDEEEARERRLDRVYPVRRYLYENEENRRSANGDEFDGWKGRWMPDRPTDPLPPPKVFPKGDQPSVYESSHFFHGIPMGQPLANCDDAKTNLTIDWDGSPINYTCYNNKIVPDRNTLPLKYSLRIPKYYVALHKCMHESIEYNDDLPLFGAHRPLWPVYGDYKFLPKQRWLHNLEHGAIVALYHPCANPMEVKRLKTLVTGCLRRHVISPHNTLSERRPLALLAWGSRLTMSYVNPDLVVRFIREHALRGPENIARDGDFQEGLLHRARTVSDLNDTILCPNASNV